MRPPRSLALVLFLGLAACGQQLVDFPNTPPRVTQTTPGNLTVQVPTGTDLTATFSQTMNASTLTATSFLLASSGGSVAGSVSYADGTATFQPGAALLAGTTYTATITTGAKNEAQVALAQSYVWSFTTAGTGPDTNAPIVLSTSPANLMTGVAAGSSVSATFSYPMNAASFTSGAMTVALGQTPVAGTVVVSGATATFTPAASLAAGTTYDATILAGVLDNAGLALEADYHWTFTTSPPVDTTPPTILSTEPANLTSDVQTTAPVSVFFSKPMDPATLDGATFILSEGNTLVAGAVTSSQINASATFTPTTSLAPSTTYTATVTTGAQDLSGNALAADYVWTFTTSPPPDTTPPTILSTEPANLAIAVPVTSPVTAFFSEPMDPSTLDGATFNLSAGNTLVAGAVTSSQINASATFTPTTSLAPSTTYTATVTTGARDPSGNALAANYVWTFTTAAASPSVVSTNPAAGAANLCIAFAVDATFNTAMNPLTLTPASFILQGPGTAQVAGSVSYDDQTATATFAPASNLAGNTTYTATITTAAQDVAGTALAANKVWTFTTNATLCALPVNLRSLSTFVAVAGAGLSNSNSAGVTVLNGDVGISPGSTCTGDGSPCSALDPTIHGTLFIDDPAGEAAAAKADLVSAYDDAMGRPPGTTEADLAGMTLAPGVYTSASTMTVAVGGTVTLDGRGDPNSLWIFQIGSSLTVNNNAQILLINSAQAANVFWAVAASSTLGGGVQFNGTILAQSSSSLGVGTVVNGRLLCNTGQITLLDDTVNLP